MMLQGSEELIIALRGKTMNAGVAGRRQSPFQFVLDELLPIRPTVKQMFGFTYVYLDGKLLLSIRDKEDRQNDPAGRFGRQENR